MTVAALGLALALAGCATAPDRAETPAPVAGPREPEPALPAIPRVDGPLELRVSYPRDSMRVATRGDNFIFGSTGNGDARVWINDEEVDVHPNGGFLAFLPVPPDGLYRLRATLGERTATLDVPVRLPPAPPATGDGAVIVAGSAYPRGGWVARPDERIEAGFRGTAGGRAWLVFADGSRVPLIEDTDAAAGGATDFEVTQATPETRRPRELAAYRGFFAARRVTSRDTTVHWPALTGETRPSLPRDTLFERRELEAGAPVDTPPGEVLKREGEEPEGPPALGVPLEEAEEPVRAAVAGDILEDAGVLGAAARGARGRRNGNGGPAMLVLVVEGDTVRRPLPLNLLLADPDRPRVGVAHDPDAPAENGDDHINARPGPGGGPYHYTWRNGAELELTGERNGIYRVRLTDDLDAWTPSGDIRLRPAGTVPPTSRVSTVRLDPQPDYIDVHVGIDRPLPYRIDEGDRRITLSVFGATSRANFLQHGRVDPYIERAEWSQPQDRRFQLDLHLTSLPWGYEVFWGEGDDLVLRLNRPPTLDPGQPLRGVTVGVDPGHGGDDRYTMGPTGFPEADANLGIALALARALEERGAIVALTRSADTTLSLVERTEFARDRDVDLLVSVHNNAFPDGVNPFENNGTSVYYNHAPSAGLAWAVHEELLEEMGLRDLGVGRADLHLARFTWAPAILTENAFMMIPAQEAFLKSDEGQRRIAEAHVRGIERWLRSLIANR